MHSLSVCARAHFISLSVRVWHHQICHFVVSHFSHSKKHVYLGWIHSNYVRWETEIVSIVNSPVTGYGHNHFDSYSLLSSSTSNFIFFCLPFTCLLLSSTILVLELSVCVDSKCTVSIYSRNFVTRVCAHTWNEIKMFYIFRLRNKNKNQNKV